MTSVSVVIPCFNLGTYLREAVDSVQAQTRAADEVVVVDDGSTDEGTIEALNGLRAEGLIVYRTPNRGAPRARNFGIERSRGDFLLCLDADDVLLPGFLERTVDLLAASPDVGIVATEVEFFGKTSGTWRPPGYSLSTMLWRNCLPSASLFRRTCWEQAGGYAPALPACQDWDLWLSILERGWRWAVVNESLYRYRRRDGSISDRRERERPQILADMMRRHSALYGKHAIDAIVELDAELKDKSERLARFRRDNAAKAKQIAALAEAARPPEHEQVQSFRALIEAHLPERATVLVVTKGDADLLKVGNRESWHFPRRPDGKWLGHHPKSDEAASAMLEEMRAAGAEFLCFPRDERWWLKRYDRFRRYLECGHSAIARTEEGVIFDIRHEIPRRAFSVVICTYRRPDFVARSMRSVFEQTYPKDRYELIVVNNASPDDTEEVVLEAAKDSPVAFTYLVEERNGLSHARNRGIAAARHDYVAFLDDDAIACPDWLATFNAVIDEHHAMVVGGRVEKAFEDGFEPPDWFRSQYPNHMFGVNYRDRGRKEKVFRIRYPLYLGGGNAAYARKLFGHFGGFDPRLGRDGKSLRAGEESYLNLILDRHDIPIYYTDDAWIDHYLETSRLTKKHLRRKAYWSAATNAVIHPMFFGFPEVRGRTKENRKEIRRRLKEIRSEPRSPENFSRQLRLVYNVAFLWRFHLRYLGYRVGRYRKKPQHVSWGVAQWIEEVRSWPDGPAKYERLRDLALEAGYNELAEEAERKLKAPPSRPSKSVPAKALSQREYERLAERVRARVAEQVPPRAHVAVVSKGDERLLRIDGRRACHFPQIEDGTYAGHYPADAAAAVKQLQELLDRGVTHLVFPSTSLWWLTHYDALSEYLDGRHERVWEEPDTCVVYRLRENHLSAPVA